LNRLFSRWGRKNNFSWIKKVLWGKLAFLGEIMGTNDPKKKKSEMGKMIPCPRCNFLNPAGSGICKNCRVNIDIASFFMRPSEPSPGLDAPLIEKKKPEKIKPIDIKKPHKMWAAFKALRVLAWLTFIAVIIGAIGIGKNYANVGRYPLRNADLNNIGIGIAILMFGIFLGIFLLVIASISENLIVIRQRMDQILDTGVSILESISKRLKFPSQ
jgi:hypothetical protein